MLVFGAYNQKARDPFKSPSDTTIDLKTYLDIYKLYRDYAMQESALISSRLTWIITINGFLFACAGALVQKLNDPEAYPLMQAAELVRLSWTKIFIIVIVVFALLINSYGISTIKAAQDASHALAAIFDHKNNIFTKSDQIHVKKSRPCGFYTINEEYLLPGLRGGGSNDSINRGHAASKRLPFIFICLWVIIFLISVIWPVHELPEKSNLVEILLRV